MIAAEAKQPPTPATKGNFWFQLVLAAAMALTVLGYRWNEIHAHALQFPINDQWYSDYASLYQPYLEGTLTFAEIFRPNNEHIIALQKVFHLCVFVLVGEWNPLAQMFINAVLFAVLLFIGSFLCGIVLPPLSAAILQVTILMCGLMPASAENFLFGFQTGWYFYYFASAGVLWALVRSEGIDSWWFAALVFAVCSCMCLASGVANIFLAMVAPVLQERGRCLSPRKILGASVLRAALCLPLILIFAKIAINGRPEIPPGSGSVLVNILRNFSYPLVWLPFTYLPVIAVVIVFLRGKWHGGKKEPIFAYLFVCWALMHAVLLAAGRGGFSGRHTELILIGIVANVLALLTYSPSVIHHASPWRRRAMILWIAAIWGGLACRMVESREAPRKFADFMLPRFELVKDAMVLRNPGMLTSKSWDTGLPAALFAEKPGLLSDPVLARAAPGLSSVGMELDPAPEDTFLKEFINLFPSPFPFQLWARVGGAGKAFETKHFTAVGISQPYAKVVFAGRWENPATGLHSESTGGRPLIPKMPFSQAEGWRAVFLPTKNGAVSFTVCVAGERDWLLLQQPISCSALQYVLETVGRQSGRLWAICLGISLFLILAGYGRLAASRFG